MNADAVIKAIAAAGLAVIACVLFRRRIAPSPQCDASVRVRSERRHFCSFLSHAVRTPIQGLQYCLERIRESIESDCKPDPSDLAGALACADHVSRFVSGALELANLDAHGILVRRGPLDVGRALVSAHRIATAEGGSVRADLRKVLGLWVEGDECKFTEVVVALLANASRHARSTEPVELTAVRARPDPRDQRVISLEVRIRDRGIGIAPHILEGILKPYACMHPHGSGGESGHTGLGIPIALRLLQAMNADAVEGTLAVSPAEPMRIESASGRGTTITCVFSFREASTFPPISPRSVPSPKSPTPRRALVVEDNRFNQRALEAYLRAMGVEEVRVANHGAEAVDFLRSGGAVDLILMDIQMPVMDGVEATRVLRGEGLYLGPIIAVTGNGSSNEVHSYIEAGMDDVLVKPVTRSGLAVAVRKCSDANPLRGRRFSL